MKRIPVVWIAFTVVQLVGIIGIMFTAYTSSPVFLFSFVMLFPGSLVMQAAHPFCYAHFDPTWTFVIEMSIMIATNAVIWSTFYLSNPSDSRSQ